MLDEAQSALREVKEIVAEAREAGATGVRLQALDRLERFLRLLGAVTGELKPDAVVAVVNIQRSAEWIQIRGILMEELEPYPDLKARIVTRLAATAETGSLRSALPPSMVVANGIGKAEVIVDP